MRRSRVHNLRAFFIAILLTTTFVSVVITAGFFYLRTSSLLNREARADAATLLTQVSESITKQISLVDATFPMFVANPTILGYIDPSTQQYDAPPTQKRIEIERQMTYLLINTYLWSERYIRSVYIYDSNGNHYSVTKSGNGRQERESSLALLGSLPTDQPELLLLTSPALPGIVSFVRNIYSPNNGNHIASILIHVDEQAFRSQYSTNLGKNMMIALADVQGHILSCHGDAALVGDLIRQYPTTHTDKMPEIVVGQETWIVAAATLASSSVRSYVALPRSSIYAELNQTMSSVLTLMVGICVVMMVVSLMLSTYVTNPIHRMMQQVRGITSGRSRELTAGMYAELNELAAALNQMLGRLDDYYQDLYETELARQSAQIKLLRSQINPHFLFNVLNTISWKAQLAGDDEVARLTVALGDLLRSSIMNEDADEVPLGTELENIGFYLALQKARFEERLTVSMDIPATVMHCMVPRLSLQPLVENAIVHGLERKPDGGTITLTVMDTEDGLTLTVADNGVGFDTADLQNRPTQSDSHTHIGIVNLQRRITILYGEGYGLTINSEVGQGTTATMTLPKKGDAALCLG